MLASTEYSLLGDTIFELNEDLRSFRDHLASRLRETEDPLLGEIDDMTDEMANLIEELIEKEDRAFQKERDEGDAEV